MRWLWHYVVGQVETPFPFSAHTHYKASSLRNKPFCKMCPAVSKQECHFSQTLLVTGHSVDDSFCLQIHVATLLVSSWHCLMTANKNGEPEEERGQPTWNTLQRKALITDHRANHSAHWLGARTSDCLAVGCYLSRVSLFPQGWPHGLMVLVPWSPTTEEFWCTLTSGFSNHFYSLL